MENSEVKKNTLDLAYKRNLQLVNVLLITGAGALISIILGIILNPAKMFNYLVFLIIIFIITFIGYTKLNIILRNISEEIMKLSDCR